VWYDDDVFPLDTLMRRYPRYASVTYSFGPGSVSPAVKAIIWANVSVYVLTWLFPILWMVLGLQPVQVVEHFWIWQPFTYMFVHAGPMHILVNMLGIWMFGVELERLWGTRFFVRYYLVTGLGAAATSLVWSLLPLPGAAVIYQAVTVGASGALFGLLLAYALYYPDRPILLFLLFPIPAKYFVIIIGAISFMAATQGGGTVAETAHLGGLLAGYLYLRGTKGLVAELKYRYLRWKMARLRRRFDVHQGGRHDDWNRHIH
jgi:membrane associated rhomboid family serine protease